MTGVTFDIKFIPYKEMETILPLAYILNNGKISMATLKNRFEEMLAMGGYQCIGVYDRHELIGICGVWLLNKLYAGKHVEPDNVFIKEQYRSSGVGKLMLDYLIAYAKEQGCIGAEVNCYKFNSRGNQFWEAQGFEPKANHLFLKF